MGLVYKIKKINKPNRCVCCNNEISSNETIAKFDYVIKSFVNMCNVCADIYQWTQEERWFIEEFGIESFRILVKEIQQKKEMEKYI